MSNDLSTPEWLAELEQAKTAPPIYIDRSTLERYQDCPAQGAMVESGQVMTASPEADTGQEVHEAISTAVSVVVEGGSYADVTEAAIERMYGSRPDVQPEVIDALRSSLTSIIRKLLYHGNGDPRHPDDILRFDGGEGSQCGQLAYDITTHEGRPVRLTCEVDLLMAAGSAEELDMTDWKSGRSIWSGTDIQQSFQLGCFYPLLVFINHPDLQRLNVRVWNTRINRIAGAVAFSREHVMRRMHERIRRCVDDYLQYSDAENPPAWPAPQKCARCPAAALCPEARGEIREAHQDPQAAARQLIAMQEGAKQLKQALTSYVDEHGPVQVDGYWFGRNVDPQPPKRKPAAGWHTLSDDEGDESE